MHSNSAESSFWHTLILAYSFLKLAIAAPAELNSTESWNPERRFFRELACDTADFFGIGSDNNEAYSPVEVKCPKEYTWIRPADSLSAEEQDYLKRRRPRLEESWAQRMKAVGLKDLPRTPVVALALSGGGYRAMVSGSGMAFQQNNSAESVGDLVGISTYVSGLSGGSWALSSFYANNGMQPSDLAKNVWNLQSNLGFPSKDPIKFYTDLLCAVKNKNGKEFATQITDYWGLALSNHLFPKEYHTDAKPNLRWSDIPKISSRVRDADLPWPIIVAVEREEGEMIVGDNSTTYEFNLAEFGAWTWGSEKRSQGAFTPVRSIGTTLDNGWPRDMSKCYENFDNAGFVAGTSSSIFSGLLMQRLHERSLSEMGLFGGPLDVGEDIIDNFLILASTLGEDVSVYPNPFFKWTDQENPNGHNEVLTLVDGGMANENIPLEPFLQPERVVDTIFAMDNSADSPHNWPEGVALYTTYQKSVNQSKIYNIPETMPPMPPREGFVNSGMNTRPVFFGCDLPNIPTIIYIPNSPWNHWSNHSTFQLQYSLEETLALVDNGRRSLELNGTVPNWGQCLTCAMINNAVLQSGKPHEEACQACLKRWCWDGKLDATKGKTTEYHTLGQLPPLPLG